MPKGQRLVAQSRASALTDLVLSAASLISSQHGPMIFRLTTSSSKGDVLEPKIWLKVAPLVPIGSSASVKRQQLHISMAQICSSPLKP
jgi:hypothetical protein